jgi:hypothetical protein
MPFPLFSGPKGLQNSAQGFNPGIVDQERCALTRRYFVAPCRKNTRFAGLEVLKGRQIERSNKAEAGSDGPIVARPNCAL